MPGVCGYLHVCKMFDFFLLEQHVKQGQDMGNRLVKAPTVIAKLACTCIIPCTSNERQWYIYIVSPEFNEKVNTLLWSDQQ